MTAVKHTTVEFSHARLLKQHSVGTTYAHDTFHCVYVLSLMHKRIGKECSVATNADDLDRKASLVAPASGKA